MWHKGLLTKIEAVGIRGNLALWFQNYLLNSTFWNSTGVCVRPLVISHIYINDITKNIESVIKHFADDTSVSLALKDPDRRAAILNSDLEKNTAGRNAGKLVLIKKRKKKEEEEKNEFLTFKKDNHPVYPLSFGNIVLEDNECHKHLGLIFLSNCKSERHINSIIRKVTLFLFHVYFPLDTMYKSFILPQFDYADIVWDNCSGTLSNMLENLHLEAIIITLGAVRGTSHETLYKESGFCTLKERRKRHKLLMFHKMINHQCPGYLSNLVPPLVSTTNPYHRRRPHERVIPAHKTELYANSFIPSTT